MAEYEVEFNLSGEQAAKACQHILPQAVREGIALFNQGQYFEAHEILELAWRAEREPVRELYRGILQVGVAYYHLQHDNYRGAVKMLQRADGWLAPFSDRCCGIDLGRLRLSYRRVLDVLLRVGPQGLKLFDTSLFEPVIFDEENKI